MGRRFLGEPRKRHESQKFTHVAPSQSPPSLAGHYKDRQQRFCRLSMVKENAETNELAASTLFLSRSINERDHRWLLCALQASHEAIVQELRMNMIYKPRPISEFVATTH